MAKKLLCILLMLMITASACMRSATQPEQTDARQGIGEAVPELPEEIELVNNVPQISVYKVDEKTTETMDLETYLMGVLAGEMNNSWPMEALKAQAILARTFVLNFISEKDSMYEDADISTDIREAQAYDAANINDRIRDAVKQTAGLVVAYDGRFAQTWFHAHSGGMTELPTAGLEYKNADPPYMQAIKSPESDKAPASVQNWTATFSAQQIAEACKELGIKTGDVTSIEIGRKGASGRAITLIINGKEVSAPSLRLQLGSTEMKSTLLHDISIDNGQITFSGSGYGHGVGMSQWGAYSMAERGDNAQTIIEHYFRDVTIEKVY